MTIEVVEQNKQNARCYCGALLKYGMGDIIERSAIFSSVFENKGAEEKSYYIMCPECNRSVSVSG